MNKHELRIHIRNQFKTQKTWLIIRHSQKIYEHLFNWDGWKAASKVGITMSTDNEISTLPIIERGWEEGKKIAIPKVAPKEHTLHFYEITSFSQTKTQFAGIREPDPRKTVYSDLSHFDLMIVPGLAFDREKYRLGFGGGFYDRILSSAAVLTCGLALDFQLLNHIPREPHDIPLDVLITEHGQVR